MNPERNTENLIDLLLTALRTKDADEAEKEQAASDLLERMTRRSEQIRNRYRGGYTYYRTGRYGSRW